MGGGEGGGGRRGKGGGGRGMAGLEMMINVVGGGWRVEGPLEHWEGEDGG